MATRFLLAALIALAPPAANLAEASEWEYRVTPYAWIPSFDAEMAIGDESGDGSGPSFWELLEFAVLINGEARRGDWALIGEYNYLALSDDAEALGGRLSADILFDGHMAGAAVAYRFHHDERASAEVFGGARAWWIDAEIDLQRISNPSVSRNWVDPIIGMRGSYALTDRVALSGLADIGGFGVGSDLQWELIGRVGYEFTDHIGAALGYRHLALDFADDKLVLDAEISGPFLAIDIMW